MIRRIAAATLGLLGVLAVTALGDTSTPRMGLTKPSIGSTGWAQKTNSNYDVVDSSAAVLGAANTFTSTNTFMGAAVFSGTVTINASVNGSSITNLNASNLATGTVPNARLDGSSVTLQGNTFNAASSLVRLDGTTKLPAVDGSQLTNLPAAAGSAVLASTQTFTGANTFKSSFTVTGSSFSVNGSTFVITAGNVGLGTYSPTRRLHIKGFSGGKADLFLDGFDVSATSQSIYFGFGGAVDWTLQEYTGGFRFQQATTDIFRMNNNGTNSNFLLRGATITATNTGLLSLGTTATPAVQWDVTGSGLYSGTLGVGTVNPLADMYSENGFGMRRLKKVQWFDSDDFPGAYIRSFNDAFGLEIHPNGNEGTVFYDSTDSTILMRIGDDSDNGNLVVNKSVVIAGAGNGLRIAEGVNASMGQSAVLVATGTIVNTAVVDTNTRIFLQPADGSSNVGFVYITGRTSNTFTIQSSNALDTRRVNWLLIEPQ